MRQSKIQMVDLTLGKVLVSANSHYKNPSDGVDSDNVNLSLQSAKTAHKSPDYWSADSNVEDNVRNHTYTVNLGVRTPLGGESGYPYNFEVQFSAVIVNFDPTDGNPDKMAVKYGLALLYGAIRDQVMSLTSRMKSGKLLIPTMSFDDESYDDLFEAHQKISKRSAKVISSAEPAA